jgi:aryl-alcohol dehydrogenase-like predicted oxidoreductase
MLQRSIAGKLVPAIGLGCMNLSHAYGTPPDEAVAISLLHRALDLGIHHFDTAALYGFGRNETLLGKAFKGNRHRIYLASKCGMTGVDGKRVLDGRPETLVATLDESLSRLQTDHINLWYLHRWDRSVAIEDSVGAMARMVEAGKVGAIGLSEVSAATLRRAHAVHPIAALQSEYSLWTRNAEIAVLDACREIGAAFVAFSPLARGFLANPALDPAAFADTDLRRTMPRFKAPHFGRNRVLLWRFIDLAEKAGCTPAQLALVWLLSQGGHVLPIPGTTSIAHLEENAAAMRLNPDPAVVERAGVLINQDAVSGPRYNKAVQREIDTEEF